MSNKIKSPGYIDKVDQQRKNECRTLLCEHMPLLLENRDVISSKPEFFFCDIEGSALSLAYIGGGSLTLGMLVTLWSEDQFIETCPDCSGKVYLVHAGGSPLTGNNSWGGVCPVCQKVQHGCSESFPDIWQKAYNIIKMNKNEPIIKKGDKPIFSWSKGVIPAKNPENVLILDKVHGSSLEQVIERLQEIEKEKNYV